MYKAPPHSILGRKRRREEPAAPPAAPLRKRVAPPPERDEPDADAEGFRAAAGLALACLDAIAQEPKT